MMTMMKQFLFRKIDGEEEKKQGEKLRDFFSRKIDKNKKSNNDDDDY